jgi:hypothetical protein
LRGWLENQPKVLQLAAWQQANLKWMPRSDVSGQARHDKVYQNNFDPNGSW